MVRRSNARIRRRASNRRQRNISRTSNIKRLNKAVDFRPTRSNCPTDPPAVNLHIERSFRIPIRFMYDSDALSNSWINNDVGKSFDVPVYVVHPNNIDLPSQVTLSYKQIVTVFSNITGMQASLGKNLDVAIQKVSFWGPVIGTLPNPSTITLHVDPGHSATGVSISDTGTAINRPRVACHLPFTHWADSDSDQYFVSFEWDSGNKIGTWKYPKGAYEIGFAHITVLGRYVQETSV